jgi:hypothetical protein
MRQLRERRKSAGLRAVTRWVPRQATSVPYTSHRLLEARSLAMHALIASKITQHPALLAIPHRNLARWRTRWRQTPPPWFTEWRALLARPWAEVAALITEPSEEAARLRQSTPFAGVLSVEERRRIYEAFRA